MTLDTLRSKLPLLEQQRDQAIAQVNMVAGAIEMTKQLITEAEKEETEKLALPKKRRGRPKKAQPAQSEPNGVE